MTFLGSDSLVIDHAAGAGGGAGPLLTGFGAGDSIDLRGVVTAGLHLQYAATTGVLALDNAQGQAVESLLFAPSSLGSGTFQIAPDGHGGALLTHG
jgi:hypothetical protein